MSILEKAARAASADPNITKRRPKAPRHDGMAGATDLEVAGRGLQGHGGLLRSVGVLVLVVGVGLALYLASGPPIQRDSAITVGLIAVAAGIGLFGLGKIAGGLGDAMVTLHRVVKKPSAEARDDA